MFTNTLLIVSDKFENFASRKDVLTVSQLYQLLKSDNILLPENSKIRLIPGQGFSDDGITELLHTITQSENAKHFDSSMWRKVPKRAGRELTHKHQPENILISEPKATAKDEFMMDILIDENCEMMRDHQTGLHVQGILLLEAARQGYLAIFEKHLLPEGSTSKYFVFNNLNVNYNKFAFPLPATLTATIRSKDTESSKKQEAVMDMSVMQCGSCSASFSVGMTVIENKRISLMETKLADQSLTQHINAIFEYNKPQETIHA